MDGHASTGVEPVVPAVEDAGTEAGTAGAGGRVLLALCVSSFLAVLNFAAPAPFFPEMAADLGTTVPLLGQVATMMLLLSTALGLGIGPLADRYGHRRLVVLGVVAVAANLLGIGLSPSYAVVLGVSLAGGLGDAILFGLPLAIAGTVFAGDARRRAVGWTSAALPSATIVGVPVLAAIGGAVGWRAVFVGTGLATLAVAGLVAAWLPRDARRPTEPLRARALFAAYRPLLRHAPTLRLYGVSALRAACWIGLLTYLGAFLAEARDLDTGRIGLAYLAGGAGFFLGSLVAGGRRLGQFRPGPLVGVTTAGQGLVLGAIFVLPLGTAATLALLPLAGFGGAVGFVGLATLLSAGTPGGAATTMVLNGSVINLGSAGGAALGGLLLAMGGYEALGIGLPLFALGAAVLAWTPARGRSVEQAAA